MEGMEIINYFLMNTEMEKSHFNQAFNEKK